MKNKIFAVLILLVFWNSILLKAQQPPRLHKWETNNILLGQQKKREHTFDNQNVYINPSHYQSYKTDIAILNAIIPDFQVNENAGPNGAYQSSPSISAGGSGDFVMTWIDHRNGDTDIYAQRYLSNGTAFGTNFKVNDDQGSASQRSPSISTGASGNFVITWSDRRNGDPDIYAQRYASDGSILGTNFKVNDDQGTAPQGYPSISTDGSGNFVITWEDSRNGTTAIFVQRYSRDGALLGFNFKVNDDQGGKSPWYPCISTDDNGNFVIAWQKHHNQSDWDIYDNAIQEMALQ